MKSYITMISIVEVMLIAALSGSGTYTFINSDIYSLIKKLGEINNPLIYYVPFILWGLLFVFGVFNITIRGRGSGSFIWFVTLLSLPSLLSYNIIDWLGIFGLEFKLRTNLTFYDMLALGVLIITSYIIFSYIRIFKQLRHNLINRGANPTDIEGVTFNSYLTLLLAIIAALATTTAITFLSRNLELLVLDYLMRVPWNVVFIGLLCTLLLAAYLYWLGARRRPKDQSLS